MNLSGPEKRKLIQVKALDTEALRKICERHEPATPTQAKPLAGYVHIVGIGQVPVRWLDDELATR